MTIDLYPTIAARIGDPGAYVERKLTPGGEPMETASRWAARAVVDAVQPVIDELTSELARVNAAFKDAVAELGERYAERDAALNRAHRAETDAAQIARAKDGIAAERDAMRPVVEAAKEWRGVRSESANVRPKPEAAALIAAVDAPPKAATI